MEKLPSRATAAIAQPRAKSAAMTSATGSPTFASRMPVGAILSATVMTYCWIESTRVPLTNVPSSPSQTRM